MDADYLKRNLGNSLVLGLTSMASLTISTDDRIDFLGHFLLRYVEIQRLKQKKSQEYQEIEKLNEIVIQKDTEIIALEELELQKQEEKKKQLEDFIQSISSTPAMDESTKLQVMEKTTQFISDYSCIPNVCMALKKTINDTDYLCYVAASSGQEFVVGNKLMKPSDDDVDADDVPKGQGLSFDAFKIAEMPEEEEDEEPEEDEDGNPIEKPPKVIPTPQPLVIENVMRNKRIKFFGIPKLGSLVVVPFSFESCDHENGCLFRPLEEEITEDTKEEADEEEQEEETNEDNKDATTELEIEKVVQPKDPFLITRNKSEFVICFDSIGDFKTFQTADIEQVQSIGNVLAKTLERIETDFSEKQKEYLNAQLEFSPLLATCIENLNQLEAEALVEVIPEPTEVNEEEVNEEKAEEKEKPEVNAEEDEDNEEGGEGDENKEENDAEEAPVEVEPVVVPESFKPYDDAKKGLQVWNHAFEDILVIQNSIQSLQTAMFPLPSDVCKLFYIISLFLGFLMNDSVDCFGDLRWELIKKNILPTLTWKISSYDVDVREVTKTSQLSYIKTYLESNPNCIDLTVLPTYIPVLPILITWLQKAINARELSQTYFRDANNDTELEILV